jgi:hypothetical protein
MGDASPNRPSPLVGEDSHRAAMTDEGRRLGISDSSAVTPHLRAEARAVLSHKGRGPEVHQ